MKVACFSVAAMDYFPQQKAHFAGGNSLNQAIRFRRLGFETAFLGALGTDEAGDRIYALLAGAGVDVARTARVAGETPSNQLIDDESGERFGVEGAWRNGVYGEYRLTETDWSHIANCEIWATHANCPDYAEALRRKPAGAFMSVDFLHLRDYELLERSLETIDIAYFGGTEDMAGDLARIAAKTGKPVVLTLGAAGSVAFQGDRRWVQPALPIERVLDTTGCGDAFQAGCTAEFFRSRDLGAAILAGAKLGREAAGHYGGVPWK